MPPTKTYKVALAGCKPALLNLTVREGERERGGDPARKTAVRINLDTDVAATFPAPLRHEPVPQRLHLHVVHVTISQPHLMRAHLHRFLHVRVRPRRIHRRRPRAPRTAQVRRARPEPDREGRQRRHSRLPSQKSGELQGTHACIARKSESAATSHCTVASDRFT